MRRRDRRETAGRVRGRLGGLIASRVGLLYRLATVGLLVVLLGMPAAASERLTIVAAHKLLCLPLYVAENQGYFTAEGVQVEIKDEVSGNRAMQLLFDGKADLVTAADTVIMFHSFRRNDFVVLATLATGTNVINFIAGKALGYARPEQLAGKRVGTVIGTASDYYVDSWLVFHGLDPKAIRQISLQPENMATALERREVDAVAIWDPFGFEILKAVPGSALLPNPGIYNLSFNLVAGRSLAETQGDKLTRVLRALLRAERFIRDEPEMAQAILRKNLNQDQGYIDERWRQYKYRISLDQSLITTLESEARWARSEGHVVADRSPNYLRFVNSQPLRMARPDRMRIGK